jgi:hypothetical protein
MTKTPPSTAGTGAVYPEQYEEQLQDKISKVKDLFAGHKLPAEIEVHRSSTSHFRMRTEFRVWHEGQDLCYVMFEQPDGSVQLDGDAAAAAAADGSESDAAMAAAAGAGNGADAAAAGNGADAAAASDADAEAAPAAAAEPPAVSLQSNGQPKGKSNKKKKRGNSPSSGGKRKRVTRVRIDDFPMASQLICSLMPLLRQELIGHDTLRERLFQVNFHTTLSNQVAVTLAYHKQVDKGGGSHALCVCLMSQGCLCVHG